MRKPVSPSNGGQNALFLIQYFLCGAVVMGVEIAGGRLLNPKFGSSLFVWGSLIGVFLAALSLGYFGGGFLAEKRPTLGTFAAIVLVSGFSVLAIPLFAAPVMDAVSRLGQPERYAPVLASALLFGVPAALLGLASPFSVKLAAAKGSAGIGNVAGNLYALSTVGGIAGTFLATFLFVPYLGTTATFFWMGTCLVAVSLPPFSGKRAAIVPIVIAYLALVSAVPAYRDMSGRSLGFTLNGALYAKVYEAETPYHHLLVADDRQSPIRRLFLDGVTQSAVYLNDSAESPLAYAAYLHLGFVPEPDARNLLFIGGGAFSVPEKLLKELPDARIDVAELDPAVIDVAARYFNASAGPRLSIFAEDGRVFLDKSSTSYDLIVLDAFSGAQVPFHLTTLEFFELLRSRLAPDGVLAMNLISAVKGPDAYILRAECSTLSRVFPNVYVFVVPKPVPTDKTNIIFVATVSSDARLSEQDFERGAAEIASAHHVPGLEGYAANLRACEDFGSEAALTDDIAPVNVPR